MIPRLYPSTETEFTGNGIGPMIHAVSCKSLLEFGSDEIEMEYPVDGTLFQELELRRILRVKPDQLRSPQPYRIYKITKPMAGLVKVLARHIVYDLMGIPVNPFTAPSVTLALQGLKNNAVVACPFEFQTDKDTEAEFSVPVPSSIWSNLGGREGSILDVYRGEYQFDGYTVHLWNQMGADRGVSIRYGKNLTSLEQDQNCADCYTGVQPYWLNPDTGAVAKLPENVIYAEGDYGYTRILSLDLSSEFETEPTEEALRARAQRYMDDNKIGEPAVSWKVEFIQLEQTEEYKGIALLEKVYLGDTVHVHFPKMKVSASARAVSAEYDCLRERYNSVTLGSVRQDLAKTIVDQQKELDKKPTASMMQQIAATIAQTILGAKGGSVRHLDTDGDGLPDTLYIADDPDPAKAQKVWRFNYEGWAASRTGYNGPFVQGATLEDGLLAEAVTAAQLVAGTIRSKDGSFFLDLDNGILSVGALTEVQESVNTSIDKISTDMSALSGNVNESLRQMDETVTAVNTNLQKQLNTITKYFAFDVNGMTIGAADNPNKVVIDNDEIAIMVGGVVVQRFDATGRAKIPELDITKALNLMDYLISKDSLGNLNCEYVGA